MFARAASVFVLALSLLATALPGGSLASSGCSSGDVQCCDSTQAATSSSVVTLLGLLGIPPDSVTGLVGLTCSSIKAGGNSCTQQTVCCTNNSFSGVIALGCTPIDVDL